MCYNRSLRGRNEDGRDQCHRCVRQDSPKDVINGRGVPNWGQRQHRRAWSREGMREPGYSKKGRLREQSPRQKMAWCFLEIEGHIILLELKCWMAGHRQRDRSEEEGHVAIWGCCWPRLGFRHYPKENEKPLDTFDTESPPVESPPVDFFFFLTISICSAHERVADKEQMESVWMGSLVLEPRGLMASVQVFSALPLNTPQSLATTQRGSVVGKKKQAICCLEWINLV